MQNNPTTSVRLCACGCGQPVTKGSRFVHNHNWRDYAYFLEHRGPHYPSLPDRFWQRVDKNSPVPAHCPELGPCWLWTGRLDADGYGMLSSNARYRQRLFKAHRLSYELNIGPIPEGMGVLHHCDVRRCVNPKHFFLGTNVENTRDQVAKGRTLKGDRNPSRQHPERLRRGEENPNAKLTADDVRGIRSSSATGLELAKTYGVSRSLISMIRNRKIWQHV